MPCPLLITSVRAQQYCRKLSLPTLLLGAVSLLSSLVKTPSLGFTSCSQNEYILRASCMLGQMMKQQQAQGRLD